MKTKKISTLTSKESRRLVDNPLPITIPAIPSSTVWPKNHPTSRLTLAVDIDKRPSINAPQANAPTFNPKIRPLFHPMMLSFDMSQISKMISTRNETYPSGIRRNASSGDSKNGLGSEYKPARMPACKNKSNPITASHASNPILTK